MIYTQDTQATSQNKFAVFSQVLKIVCILVAGEGKKELVNILIAAQGISQKDNACGEGSELRRRMAAALSLWRKQAVPHAAAHPVVH